MPGQAEGIAAAAYTPEERAAVDYADSFYGAEAKLEASKWMVGLGAVDEAGMVLNALSVRLDEMDFTEKREVAEHFRRLAELCGVTASATIVHLEPVHDEKIGATPVDRREPEQDANGTVDENIEDELTLAEPYKFKAHEKRFLTDLFGGNNERLISGLSFDQFKHLMSVVGAHYESLSIIRLNAEAKKRRRRITEEFLVRRISTEEIAASHGVTPKAISLGTRKMIESIRKRTDQQLLDEMVQEAARFCPAQEQGEAGSDESVS